MAGKSEGDGIDRMIDAVMKAAAGDYSICIYTSDKKYGVDAGRGSP
jgi:hypothetical protein